MKKKFNLKNNRGIEKKINLIYKQSYRHIEEIKIYKTHFVIKN